MRFLSGDDIQASVRRIVSRPGDVMAAVAYWGEGAAKRTGLDKRKRDNRADVRIICDLLSGACNPAEIEKLKRLGFSVKMLERLHAKVWISGNDVIVGSANASHNGLSGKDEEAANASIEAAILSRNPRLARQVAAWFEAQWCASSKIKQRHLDHAQELWRRRRRTGGRGFATSLTKKIRNPDPHDRFAGLRLLAYRNEGVNPKAEKFVTTNRSLYFTEEEWNEFGGENPWYELYDDCEWAPSRGTIYADFTCEVRGGEFTFNGFWQIRSYPDTDELKEVRLILLSKLPDFNGYTFSPKEQKRIAQQIQEVVTEKKSLDG